VGHEALLELPLSNHADENPWIGLTTSIISSETLQALADQKYGTVPGFERPAGPMCPPDTAFAGGPENRDPNCLAERC
jgi:hypothetical protein